MAKVGATVVLVLALMASVLAVGEGVANAQVDGDDFDAQIHIEVDLFVGGEAYYRDHSNNYLALGDSRGFDEAGSSYFKVKIAVNEVTGEVTVLETSHLTGGVISEDDAARPAGCDGFDCYRVTQGAIVEYVNPELLSAVFEPQVESRSVGEDWEITIETGHNIEDPLTQRFRFTFPKEQVLPALNPRPVVLDARYLRGLNLSVDFDGVPLIRKADSSVWYDWLSNRWFSTDWSNPEKFIDEEANGNGYVPSGGGGSIFNGGNSDGWEPGTLADGSWFLDDGSMTDHPFEGEVYDPSETIPIECELSDGAVLNLDLEVGHIGTSRDLIHICELA